MISCISIICRLFSTEYYAHLCKPHLVHCAVCLWRYKRAWRTCTTDDILHHLPVYYYQYAFVPYVYMLSLTICNQSITMNRQYITKLVTCSLQSSQLKCIIHDINYSSIVIINSPISQQKNYILYDLHSFLVSSFRFSSSENN